MNRIGILTAGRDTPALNATLQGAVLRASQRRIEVLGFIKGFSSQFNPRVPHVRLNPLFSPIPELDPMRGGTLIGASRDYVDPNDKAMPAEVVDRLRRLKVDRLICIGGDGTLNGMQALSEYLPTVLAPKTIDNDLELNYRQEPDEWVRETCDAAPGYQYSRGPARGRFDLDHMVNCVTPGFATAVYVSASGVERIRTTAESHRRIAIIEVMGRHSGYLAMGAAYGQPDIVLLPEAPLNVDRLVERVLDVYDLQKNVVIVCGEGIVDESGRELGFETASTDPAGNKVLSGTADAVRQLLIERLGDSYFTTKRRNESARAAIFTRKVGHTQRGGRPVYFDRCYGLQLGGARGRSLDRRACQWSGHFAVGSRPRVLYRRGQRERFSRPLQADPCTAGAPVVLRPRSPAIVADGRQLSDPHLHQCRGDGRSGLYPDSVFSPRQPYATLPLDQPGYQQAHLLLGLGAIGRTMVRPASRRRD